MIVGKSGSILGLIRWQQHSVALFAASAAVVVALREFLGWHWLRVPTAPAAIVGGALGIFVSFRTNAAYARWWEGRQLWGRLVNTSRAWATQVAAYLPNVPPEASPTSANPTDLQRGLVRDQILYVHVLRCLLREQDPWVDPDVIRFSAASLREELATQSSPTHAILHRAQIRLASEASAGRLNEYRLASFDRSISSLLDVQGGCERIKKTPMPRGYGFFAEQLIRAFSVVFPLAIAEDMWITTIPINVLVCLAFLMISEVGRVLEDPFTMFWNGLPLSALSRTIENNLLQTLGEEELLPALKPDAAGILM